MLGTRANLFTAGTCTIIVLRHLCLRRDIDSDGTRDVDSGEMTCDNSRIIMGGLLDNLMENLPKDDENTICIIKKRTYSVSNDRLVHVIGNLFIQ